MHPMRLSTSSAMANSAPAPRSPALTAWRVLAVTGLAVFAVMLDALVLVIAFPTIARSFPAVSTAHLSWTLNTYTIVYGALLVPAGRLADQVGRRRVFLLGVVVFTVGSLLCGLAPTPDWLIAWRALQALGGAMLTPTSLALTLAAFPRERRAVAVTLWGAIGALAVVAGPPLGAAVIHVVGWRGIFWLNLPIGAATFALGWRTLVESRGDSVPAARTGSHAALPDAFGIGLLIAAAGLIALALTQAPNWGWLSVGTLATLGAGALGLGGFIARARRVAVPAVDLALFHDRPFSLANSAMFVFNIGFAAMFLASSFFLTQTWGYSLMQAGLALMPGPLVVVAVAPIAGRLAARYGHRALLVPGGLCYAIQALLLLLNVGTSPHFLSGWLPAALVGGLGVALTLPVLSSAAAHNLPPKDLAVGSAVTQAIRQFGSVVGVALTIALLGTGGVRVAVFDRVLVMMLIAGVSASLISLGIDTRPRAAVAVARVEAR